MSGLPVLLAAHDDLADRLPPVEPPKRDGRRPHIVDRALDYVALADQGHTAARIARKRRKSQGYVSIALRLGRAIVGLEPAEIAALRSPRITWKLAQRIVREDADVVGIRHQLRTALGGFSSHNLDGRKHRKGRRAIGAGTADRPIGVAWGWDAAWFARDPLGFAESHLRYLAGVQRSVQQRAARTSAAHGAERVPVGQGLRTLQRTLQRALVARAAGGAAVASSAALSPAASPEQQALAVLEILERKLAEASREAAALLAARAPAPGRPRLSLTVADAAEPEPADSVSEALEAELLD